MNLKTRRSGNSQGIMGRGKEQRGNLHLFPKHSFYPKRRVCSWASFEKELHSDRGTVNTFFKHTFAVKKNLILFILFLCSQGEEKIEHAKDISGALKALDYAVKQPYFPRHLKSFFVAFISK